jgi:hypothetical protein
MLLTVFLARFFVENNLNPGLRRRCPPPVQRRRRGIRQTTAILDCGGKRSATPLWCARDALNLQAQRPPESAVAAALCRRSPKTSKPAANSFGALQM